MAQRMGDCRNANITPVQIRLAASMGEPGTKDPGREGKGKTVYIVEAEKRKIPVIYKERITAAKKAYGNFTNDSGPTSGKRI